MAQHYIEREVKLDVDASFVVPDLSELTLPARIEVIDQRLQSRYFDTEARDLLNARMTLRLRTGSADTGWQLKVPHPPAREEIRVDEAGDEVPAELRSLLVGVSRDAPLRPLATIMTERTIHRLLAEDGEALADVADDRVQATATGESATVSSWREVEVELGSGDDGLARAVVKRLRRAGARSGVSPSKLSRAVDAQETKVGKKARTQAAVLAYALEQQRAILAGDVALRRGNDVAVHQTRVAVRRVRSVLRCFAELFEQGSTSALDAELRWLAGLLGQVRDRQVLRRRLLALADELPAELAVGPVKSRVEDELRGEQAEHWSRLQQELVGSRYLALLSELAAWTAAPKWSRQAHKPTSYLTRLAARADRQATRRLRAATATGDASALHRARKAAKRARYAHELVQTVARGKPAKKKAAHHRALQDLIGEHQDSQLSAEVLRRLGRAAGTPAEDGFIFGILYQRESELARSALHSAEAA